MLLINYLYKDIRVLAKALAKYFAPAGSSGGGGTGDMTKAEYDTNDDGKVNAADVADSLSTPLTKSDVGLGNVDNTSDANKPVSNATQTALDAKVDETITVNGHALSANVTVTKSDIGLGNVDNTADTAKPVSTAQQTALDLKANLASPTFTGTPSLPTGTTGVTQSAGNSTTALATTAFVTTADNLKADLASPTFTGTPAAPTAADGTATTQVATTAFVDSGFTKKLLVQNNQTGTTYTLVLSDADKLVTLSNASAITLTIPTNASVAYGVGTQILLAQLGAGQVTVSPTGGVTMNSASSRTKLSGQYSTATLIKTATNTWILAGDITT